MTSFYVKPKPRDYEVACNNHENNALSRSVMPSSFFVIDSEDLYNFHELHISTISVENRGVLTGAHTPERIAAVDMFNNGPSTNTPFGRFSSFYDEPQVAYTDVIHTLRARNNTINAVAEYSFKSNTRTVTNSSRVLYNSNLSNLGVTSSL